MAAHGDSGVPGVFPHQLKDWWEHGAGAAKIGWGTPGDFDRCVRLAVADAHMTPEKAKGFCNERHHAVLGIYPATHAAMEHGRAGMTTPAGGCDADGLDASWDGDHSDLPDLTGLGVSHMEAAERALGMTPGSAPAQRAAKLGSGTRFKKLSASLAAKGAHNPSALAAWIGRRKYGRKAFHKLAAKARGKGGSSRMDTLPDDEQVPVPFVRSYPLQDISIRAGGDGRTVDAYAAVFDTPAPIHDADGDYIEVIDRRAFDRILPKLAPSARHSSWRVGVFYNHGMTLHGTPSDQNSLPIGIPLEIKVDEHGLFTRTRYHKGALADQILEAIREGSLSSYSFSGRFDRSAPPPPRGGFKPNPRTGLPTVRRTESTLREYGPTPFPAYQDAAITSVRSEQIAEQLERVAELLRSGAPLDGDSPEPFVSAAPEERGSAPEDSRPRARSGRSVREQIQANTALLLQAQYRR